ncbi:MAG: hypothetical protein P8M66_07195 [Flavobacteriaceae bacterium]|nr:hypothetical protein [Flavobacteriaceae bacterium]
MLTTFLKSISYTLHPLLMPWMAAVYYFAVTPMQYPPNKISFWLLSIILWSLVMPLFLYFVLNKFKLVYSINLKTSKERIWPLLLNSILLGYLSFGVFSQSVCELHYFFLGALITTILGFVIAVLKFKASIHMMSTGGAFIFMVLVNLHYSYSFGGIFAFFVIIMGAMASSRLNLNAHTVKELLAGLLVGVVPQVFLYNYWL